MLDDHSASAALAAAKPEIAVCGVGAIEQHSHHLPVGTDWIAISEVSRRVAAELGAFLIPAIPFSMSECHGPMEGTVWLKPATLSAVLRDVAASLRQQGIRKLLVLNGHGGNFVLEPTIQALNQEFPDFLVVMPSEVWATIAGEAPLFETAGMEVHAGESETSTELYLNPDNVKPARVDYVPPVGREFLDYAFMNQISPEGMWGVSSKGSATKGERAIAAQVRAIVAFAREAFTIGHREVQFTEAIPNARSGDCFAKDARNDTEHSVLTWQNTAWEFKAHPPQIAMLPLACLEPHGAHLPIGTDRIIVGEIARRAAERLSAPTFLLPTWSLGTSGHHAGAAGAIYLRFETLWAVVRDVVTSLHAHGIHQVALIANHGSAMTTTTRPLGNFIVKTAVRQLNYETPGLTAIWVQPFAAARDVLAALFPSARSELHAGAVETSMLMHLAPKLVGALPADHVPAVKPNYLDFAPFAKIAPAGIWGKPSEASAEQGARALDAAVQATVNYIETTFKQLEEIKRRE